MTDRDWHLLPTVTVRATGFPFEIMRGLRFEEPVRRTRDILAREGEVESLRRQLLGGAFAAAVRDATAAGDAAGLSWLSRARRAVGRGRPTGPPLAGAAPTDLQPALARWNTALGEQAAALAALAQSWPAAFAGRRAQLRRIAEDPRVNEALFLSSPGMYGQLQHERGRGPDVVLPRKLERRLVLYLQRLCAKNETQSFFGPVSYARVDPAAPLHLPPGASRRPRQRTVFTTQWMAERLALTIAGEPTLREHLRPRRSPLWRQVPERNVPERNVPGGSTPERNMLGRAAAGCLESPGTGRRVTVTPAEVAVFELCDGSRTVADLAAALGVGAGEVGAWLDKLETAGALVRILLLPGDDVQPLARLIEAVALLPALPARERWLARLAGISAAVDAFARASMADRPRLLGELEAAFGQVCGAPARRGGGGFYRDRGLVFEECHGGVEGLTLGGDVATDVLHRLGPLLRLWEAHGVLLARRHQAGARQVWERLRENGSTGVPLVAFLRELSAEPIPLPEADAYQEFTTTLAALVSAASDGRRAVLSSSDLAALALPGDVSGACPYTSIDLMLAAGGPDGLRTGDYRIVLGEVHPQPLLWVFPTTHFLPDREELIGAPLLAAVAASARRLGLTSHACLAHRRDTKIFPLALPGLSVELGVRSPTTSAVPVAEVEVRSCGDELVLVASGQPTRLYPPLKYRRDAVDPLLPLSLAPVEPPPIDLGAHTPRIELDGVVCQRERWVLPGAEIPTTRETLAEGPELLLAAWRWKQRHGMPDEVFVRIPTEPKPIYLDFRNAFLVEAVLGLARQADQVVVSEMLPSGDELWLELDGDPHCCELRMMAVAGVAGEHGVLATGVAGTNGKDGEDERER